MLEIGKFFESALRNQSAELKRAALQRVAQMGGAATVRELLDCDAGEGIRQLTLRELRDSLPDLELEATPQTPTDVGVAEAAQSERERAYRDIVGLLAEGPQTIGQLNKTLGIDADALRAYLDWMRSIGKVKVSGRARATRYHLVG